VITKLVLLIVVGLNSAQDEVAIREQEGLLASALRAGDKAALLRVTDPNLHVSLECGFGVRYFRTDLHREDWIDNASQIRIASYDAKISDIRFVRSQNSTDPALKYGELATVSVNETINFTTQGENIEKHLLVRNTWAKLDGMWKLVNRSYAPQTCNNGPQLKFPLR
jgi:hypothetical protein